jgi:hypothetical protein
MWMISCPVPTSCLWSSRHVFGMLLMISLVCVDELSFMKPYIPIHVTWKKTSFFLLVNHVILWQEFAFLDVLLSKRFFFVDTFSVRRCLLARSPSPKPSSSFSRWIFCRVAVDAACTHCIQDNFPLCIVLRHAYTNPAHGVEITGGSQGHPLWTLEPQVHDQD